MEMSLGASFSLRSGSSAVVLYCEYGGALDGVSTIDIGRVVQRTRFARDVDTTKPSARATSASL